MSIRDRYRQRLLAKKDHHRAAVYYIDADVLWSQSRERRARVALARIEESEKELTEEMLTERTGYLEIFKEWADVKETEEEPVLFVAMGEKTHREMRKDLDEDKITMIQYEATLLMRCVVAPRVDAEENIIYEDGWPLPGRKVYEEGDRESLESDDHLPGGWLRRLKNEVAENIVETVVDLELGNSQTG